MLYDGIKIIFCSVINMDIIIIAGFYGWITASFYLKDCSVTAFIVVLYISTHIMSKKYIYYYMNYFVTLRWLVFCSSFKHLCNTLFKKWYSSVIVIMFIFYLYDFSCDASTFHQHRRQTGNLLLNMWFLWCCKNVNAWESQWWWQRKLCK